MAEIEKSTIDPVSQEVVSRLVQETLIQRSVILPTVSNYSGQVEQGADQIKIPRVTELAAQTVPANGELTGLAPTVATDDLDLNLEEAVPFSIRKISNEQSRVNMLTTLLPNAARTLAAAIDNALVAQLLQVSTSAPDHRFALTADTLDKDAILESARLLDEADVPEEDRWMVITPQRKKELLAINNFIEADKFGSREPVSNGMIGRVLGYNVVMTNSPALKSAENGVLFYHRSHCAVAMQRMSDLEVERRALALRTDYVLSQLYGVKVLDSGVRGVLAKTTDA